MSVYVSEVESDGVSSWCLVWADTDRELLDALAGLGGGGGGVGAWAMRTPGGATWKHFVLTGLGLVLGPHGLRAKLMRQGARPHRGLDEWVAATAATRAAEKATGSLFGGEGRML